MDREAVPPTDDQPHPPEAGETLYAPDLGDTSGWVLDGQGTVEHLPGGVLRVTTDTPTVYWAPPTLEEPLVIDFEARTQDAGCRAIFFFMADGIGGEDIFSWQRAGDYGDYAYDRGMELYTFGMLREGCGTETNFRRIGRLPEELAVLRIPATELPAERREEYREAVARFQPYSIHDRAMDGYRLGAWMRYQVLVDGGLVRVFADGRPLLAVSYDRPLRRGKLGLRNFGAGSAIEIRNLRVSRPA